MLFNHMQIGSDDDAKAKKKKEKKTQKALKRPTESGGDKISIIVSLKYVNRTSETR